MEKEKLTALLEQYKKEQAAFENHPLWKDLKLTPKEFFNKVNEYVKNCGIDKEVWEQKLKEAKQALVVRMKEKRADYKSVDFRNFRGLRI